jgi:hypothetical protein
MSLLDEHANDGRAEFFAPTEARGFRPSLLPKLAACPKYAPEEFAGAAAGRGTELDGLFRIWIVENDEPAFPPSTTMDDLAAVRWAVDTSRILAGGHPLEARESELRIECEGMQGTQDLLCEGGGWSADLKSGQIRNYLEQQACYALGSMDRFFTDEWTVYLLFCDARELVTLQFTREEAETIIRTVKAAALDDLAVATPCDYCGWCARQWSCPQRLETVAWFLGLDPRTVNLREYATDPQALAQALNLTYEIQKDEGVHDFLKSAAKGHIESKREVQGWKVQGGRETKSVPALMLQAPFKGKTLLGLCGAQACMGACGTVNADKFSALWATAFGEDPIPPGTITTNHGAPFLAKDRRKKP